MALAAYSRAFDVQMGTTRGPRGGVRPSFPNVDGGDFLRDAEERRTAEVVDDGVLFSLEAVGL